MIVRILIYQNKNFAWIELTYIFIKTCEIFIQFFYHNQNFNKNKNKLAIFGSCLMMNCSQPDLNGNPFYAAQPK